MSVVCGFQYGSHEIKRRWDGALVCEYDWETRHPQDLIKVRAERSAPYPTSPEPAEVFTDITYAYPVDPATH